jgi:hypothetical protein
MIVKHSQAAAGSRSKAAEPNRAEEEHEHSNSSTDEISSN